MKLGFIFKLIRLSKVISLSLIKQIKFYNDILMLYVLIKVLRCNILSEDYFYFQPTKVKKRKIGMICQDGTR